MEGGNAEDAVKIVNSELSDAEAALAQLEQDGPRKEAFGKPESLFEKPVLKGTLAEKTAMQKTARAKFEAEHAAWVVEKQAQSHGDLETRHAEALDAARKRVDF